MSSPRILVTRSTHQASPLAEALRAAGLDPILIPTIEFAPPTDNFAALDAALSTLDTFHWLLFTSANAVESFAQRRQSLTIPYPLSPIPCHTAAIGPATARALESLGTKPTLIPPQTVAESLAAALAPHALQPDGTPTRMLLVRAQEARNVLETQLRTAGAHLTIAPAYRTIIPPASISAIRTLFSTVEHYPHAITFTSSSTATNLLALLEASGLTLPPHILRISIGPITTQTLHDQQLPPHAEAAEPTIAALTAAVLKSLLPTP